jgi:broad-specificity NMP kinase
MNIIITGKTGVGKSILANKLKNYIFKTDPNSKISIRDENESDRDTGNGTNEYVIAISQKPSKEDLEAADIVIEVKSNALVNRIKEL